jgi:hypothetical protein
LQNACGTDYVAALNHWRKLGLPNEGRRGCRNSISKSYLNHYVDLQNAFGTNYTAALDHWISPGLPLYRLYFDDSNPKEVRRRILEASVRAPEDWHHNAISAAYSSVDKDWMLTAVFSMRWVRGFDHQILEALKSADPEIHYQAVNAAGNWELDAAWPPIVALLNDADTPKPLLLAAIGAAASIRPQEVGEILIDLAASDDEEIAEAADEAIAMCEPTSDENENDASEWIN